MVIVIGASTVLRLLQHDCAPIANVAWQRCDELSRQSAKCYAQ